MKLIFLIFLLFCKFEKGFSFDDPCEKFSSSVAPDSSLERCPQAKFMMSDDFECYDKAFKDK